MDTGSQWTQAASNQKKLIVYEEGLCPIVDIHSDDDDDYAKSSTHDWRNRSRFLV